MNLLSKLGIAFFSVFAASAVACASPTDDAAAKSDSDLTEPRSCGGFAGFQCEPNQFCHYERSEMCGAADHMGTCKRRPQACAEIFAPVCGCDGKTYSNECDANGAGVGVARDGACEPEPVFCLDVYDPVCGADGKTYSNDCYARAAGTTVASKGECKPEPATKYCGGRLGDTCSATEYCAYEAGQSCGMADAVAQCRPRPEMCTAQYDPVCGCDRKTYSNECAAAAAAAGVFRKGACN